jgi:hypothetical protein
MPRASQIPIANASDLNRRVTRFDADGFADGEVGLALARPRLSRTTSHDAAL